MASTASDLLKIELQADGENDSAWGAKLNTAMSRLEEAIADITSIAVTSGDYTLDDTQYAEHSNAGNTSESHVAAIKISGVLTGNRSVIVPSRNKIYWVWNTNSGAYTTTVKTSAGSGIVVPQNTLMAVICDSTNVEALTHPVNVDGAMILLEQASAPSTGAGQGALYTKDDTSGQPELFFREESDGDEVRITKSGKVYVALSQGSALAGDTAGTAAAVDISANGNALVGDGTDAVATGILKQGAHTIGVPAGAMTPQTTNGPASLAQTEGSNSSYLSLDFDASTEEGAIFQIPMPQSWNAGTLNFVGDWTSGDTTASGIALALQALACGDGDALDDSWGTAVVVRDASQGTAGDIYRTAVSGNVTVGGSPAAGENVRFRVFRDVDDTGDTMTADMKLLSLKITYTMNAPEDT